jgi:hypothetical protein
MLVTAGSCNSYYLSHVEGQIRALVSVLTEKAPPSADGELSVYLDLAEIPHTPTDDGVEFDMDWLVEHGFREMHGKMRHQKFSTYW